MAEYKEPIKSELREFKLSSGAVSNAISVLLLTFMIFAFGFYAYKIMPKEQYPEVSFPQVFINTVYFGNSAKDIENLVTRPLEKEINQVDGIKNVNSTSMPDYSVIIAEFESDVDIDDAVRKVKDAVDKAKVDLPNDLTEEPQVEDVNLSEFPIMNINLSGDFSNDELRNYAEYLEDEIEDLKEITDVAIKGALEREVKIVVDLLKMEAREVSFQDIENAVAGENITLSAGEILSDNFRRAVRILGEYEDPEQMANIIVKSENLDPVYLRDIATVEFGYKDKTSIARSDGFPVVALDVIKKSGENLLFASDKIYDILDEARANVLPEDLKIQIFNDQSINTRTEVKNLENSIISGVILVVLVLLFFLGFRNSLFVGIAIPLSMLMGIMLLNLSGVTMNIVVLFSLILALGLLVDNAIVVVENIYRYKQNGYSGAEAARYGAGEVAMPIIASTATTLAAFLPLAFWPGIMGSFMKYMPLTLILVLASSLFVALVINPVLTSRFMRVEDDNAETNPFKDDVRRVFIIAALLVFISLIGQFTGIEWLRNLCGLMAGLYLLHHFVLRPCSILFQRHALPWLEKYYNLFIGFALKIPVLIFSGTFGLLILAIALFIAVSPKVEYFPVADPLYVNAFVEMPLGTDIEATFEMTTKLEEQIAKTVKKYGNVVEAVLTQIGENTSDPNNPPEPGSSPHKARITASFVPSQERGDVSTVDILHDIRNAVKGYPGVQITIAQNADGPPTGKPINLELRGEDIIKLTTLADDIRTHLQAQNIPGVEELLMDVKLGKPELLVHVDREAARRFGVSTYQIASSIRTSLFGKEISKYKSGEDEYDVYLRLEDKYRYNVNNLLNQKITFRSASNGQIMQVPISAVANVTYTSTYNAIKRKNLDRMITVFSNVLDGYNTNEIIASLESVMKEYKLPNGYTYEFTGEQQQQAEDMGFLMVAFILAIFAIFLIIVAQFNSIVSPFIIILSVFFSTIGVLLGYIMTGDTLNVIMTGVGIISLAGVVVNNAIVLIDYINLLIKRKIKELGLVSMFELSTRDIKDTISLGGATRLRPVLLTAITTVLGLIPLAVGFNFNFSTLITDWDPQIFIGGDNVAFWGPMAWTVIYGLIFATFLTLVVVPCMYWLAFAMMRATIGRKYRNVSLQKTGT
jgi:multidrug efflux pump subunit AcrB